jgi:pantoate kinase
VKRYWVEVLTVVETLAGSDDADVLKTAIIIIAATATATPVNPNPRPERFIFVSYCFARFTTMVKRLTVNRIRASYSMQLHCYIRKLTKNNGKTTFF